MRAVHRPTKLNLFVSPKEGSSLTPFAASITGKDFLPMSSIRTTSFFRYSDVSDAILCTSVDGDDIAQLILKNGGMFAGYVRDDAHLTEVSKKVEAGFRAAIGN